MRRFWLLLMAVAIAGLGIGSGVAFGVHSARDNAGASRPSVAVALTPTPVAAPTSGAPNAPAPALSGPSAATPVPTASSASAPSGRAPGTAPGGGGQLGRGVTGTIDKVSGGSVVVTARQGGQTTVTLGPNTVIQKIEMGTKADLKPGVVVTTTVRRQGGGAVGNVIVGPRSAAVLMGAAGGMGGGGGGGVGMGGATSGTVSRVEGDSLTVDTAQGPVTLTLAADTAIQRLVAAGIEDLAVGTNISVTGEPAADRSSIAAATVLLMPTATR